MKSLFFALFLILNSCTVYQTKTPIAEPVAMGYGGYGMGYPMLGFGGYGLGWGGGGLGIVINKNSVNNYSSINNSGNVNGTAVTPNLQRGMVTPQQRARTRGFGSFHHH